MAKKKTRRRVCSAWKRHRGSLESEASPAWSTCCGCWKQGDPRRLPTCASTWRRARSSSSTSRNGQGRPSTIVNPILYLAFHGKSRAIWLGERRENSLNLSELAELLDGSCRGRVIHFGTCGTLDIHGREINTFLRQTGALAVSGFKKDVDWLRSAAFEILVIDGLQEVSFTRPGMRRFERKLKETAPGLFRNLGFRMKVRNG